MIFSWGRGSVEETEMVMRQSGSDRVERLTRKRWKETKGKRQRGTVRVEETERRDGVEERERKRQW